MSTWEKAFDTFQWENRSQSTNTPLDATHLNKVNDALDVIDDRVIELQSADADMEEEIARKQDVLTFDDVPTDGSNNPVKSNGIYDALGDKVDKNGTDRLMTAAEGTKLAGIAAGAQVNVLEGVVVDSIVQPISGKKAFIDLSGKTDLSVIAYTFNSEMGYFKGAYVTYNGKLYEFIQEHTGAWNPSHVREIKATGRYVRAGNGGYNNGDRATCEGYMTKASGNYSHAEGRETQAVGECTHAEGRGTIANSVYQHVEGKYNVVDNENKYVHITGNGIDDNNRSNAMALDWDGNLEISGEVEDGNGEKISDKADKVTNATSGHLAGLDSNGNLTDSGVSPTEEVTVEGNPVTFDSPFEQDAKSVVVTVKPIQDLHGYDHPWVGGAGKNKMPMTVADIKAANPNATWNGNTTTIDGVTFEILTDNGGNVTGIYIHGTATATATLSLYGGETRHTLDYYGLEVGETYTLTGGANNVPVMWNGSESNIEVTTNSADFTVDATSTYYPCIRVYSTSVDAIVYPMVRLSSVVDSTFAPYSNICPISGIDEVEIPVTGKNLCNPTEIIDYTAQNWLAYDKNNGSQDNFHAKGGVTYVVSLDSVASDMYVINVNAGTSTHEWNTNHLSFMFAEDTDVSFNFWWATTKPSTINMQIELGSIPSDYEPYNPNSHTTTIPLPSTLYDADVDVTKGDADNRSGMVDLGDLNWIKITTNVYAADHSGMKVVSDSETADLKCEIFYPSNYTSLPEGSIAIRRGEEIWVRTFTDDLTEFENLVNGYKLVYPLATPTIISFDPTDVELLKGTNVVSTNGEKVAVTYGRSLWQDIDKLKSDTDGKLNKSDVATIEGDTASRPYSVNEFMLRSDGFYKVTQPIAQNASMTASNTTKTTIGEVLTALLNA